MVIVSVNGKQFSDFTQTSAYVEEHLHEPDHIADNGEKMDLSNLEVDTLTVEDGQQLIKDSALAFTPFDQSGQQIAGAEYRFGRQEYARSRRKITPRYQLSSRLSV